MMTKRELIDMVATEAAEASSRDLLVRRYRVHGICLVPTECMMVVEAKSPEQAVHIAKQSNWQHHLENGDRASAYDWEPDAEEIPSPNAVVSHGAKGVEKMNPEAKAPLAVAA